MKKVIIIGVVLALLGVGAFYVLKDKKSDMPVCEAGFRLDFTTRTCVPVGGPDAETATIDFSKPEISMSSDSFKFKLTREGETSKYSAVFDYDGGVTQGSATIDSDEAVKVGEEYILVPMHTNFGGSGQFTDIALFNAKSNTYIGSVPVGDRVGVSKIDVKDMIAKVNYKTRLATEPMVADPTIPAQLVVEVKSNSLKELMRLQNADYSEVEIKSPLANATVSGDFVLKGSMSGTWYFEASAPFKIMDDTYTEVAIGSVQALSDWMTTQRVPFEVKLNTATFNATGKATIIISSENVQGDDEGARKVKMMQIPITIK